jgi:hypothetical protein
MEKGLMGPNKEKSTREETKETERERFANIFQTLF